MIECNRNEHEHRSSTDPLVQRFFRANHMFFPLERGEKPLRNVFPATLGVYTVATV